MLMPCASLLLFSAHAAELTELAPALRGDVATRYDLDSAHTDLLEGGTEVGQRILRDHTVTYSGSFSPINGAAFFFELPHYAAQTVRYGDAAEMAFDPAADQGTMVGSSAIAKPAQTRGAGLGGLWIGLRGTPISESLWGDRGHRTTWLLESGLRFRDDTNFWVASPDERAAGPGAPAFRLLSSISTTTGAAEPYLRARWHRSGRLATDLMDSRGRVQTRGADLRPESRFDLSVGSEVTVAPADANGARVALDFRGTLSYISWQDIPSGTYLPDVLEASSAQVATQSERVEANGQFGINWRFHEFVQLNVAGRAGVHTPYRVEHFYPVETGLGLNWGVTTTLRFRVRDPMFDGLAPAANDTPRRRPEPLAAPPTGA